MGSEALDFTRVTIDSFGTHRPEVTPDQFGRPCGENSSLRDYYKNLPTYGVGKKFRDTVKMLADVRRAGRPMLLGVGASVVKDGVAPILVDLIKRNLVSSVVLTGRVAYLDVEIAVTGGLLNTHGAGVDVFLSSKETAEVFNDGVKRGALDGKGLGEALGIHLTANNFKNNAESLLFNAHKHNIPVTVHPTIGTDTSHFLPTASGEAIGKTAHLDFRIFSAQVANLQGGVYINSGSARTLPELFAKALLASRALGYQVDDFATLFLGDRLFTGDEADWLPVMEETQVSCICIEGPYGLLYPLLIACLLDELSETC